MAGRLPQQAGWWGFQEPSPDCCLPAARPPLGQGPPQCLHPTAELGERQRVVAWNTEPSQPADLGSHGGGALGERKWTCQGVGRPGQGRRRRGPGSRPSELGVSLLNKGSHSWLASAVVLATPERVPALSGDPSPHLSSTETPAAASSAPQSPLLLSGKMGCSADLPASRVTVGWTEVLYETGLCLGRQRHQPVFQGAGSKEQDADSGHL